MKLNRKMVLIKPQLRLIGKHKLYLSRRPGFFTWLFTSITIFAFTQLCSYVVDNTFVLTVLFLGSIIFGLDVVGNWEDVMLDQNQNVAIVTKYGWNEKLFLKHLEKSVVVNLSDIRHVGASPETGIFFLSKTGTTITFNAKGLSRDDIQTMKKTILRFLEANRINSSGPCTTLQSYEKCSSSSDCEEETPFKNYREFSEEIPENLYYFPNRSETKVVSEMSIHKRMSTPVFTVSDATKTEIKARLRKHQNRPLSESKSKLYVQKCEL